MKNSSLWKERAMSRFSIQISRGYSMARGSRRERLARNFSRYAHLYDEYANIQSLAGCELLRYLPDGKIARILEIGCGTGNYTTVLKDRFTLARIEAFDISEEMVRIARRKLNGDGVGFLVKDAEAMESTGKFDLITSNAAFQWLEKPGKAIANFSNMLAKNGSIAFSTFGPRTFMELNSSLKGILDRPISADKFLDKDDLEKILGRHFIKVRINELIVKERYNSLTELLKKIKYTGAGGDMQDRDFLFTRTLLKRIEDLDRK